jgi:SAM-dependent methyltransferase
VPTSTTPSPPGAEATPCLSVVVPCFNEEPTIAKLISRVLESPWTAEVVVVDDGSVDGSADVVQSMRDPRVRLLRQPRNMGKGAALRRGFVEVTSPFVVVQDADLEYDPDDYGVLLGPLIAGDADVVYGSRFHTARAHRVLYYWHSVGNKLLTTLSNMTTNLNLTDMETCYKAFRREVIQSIDIEEDRFGFEPEVTAKVAVAGWRVYEVGVGYRGRTYEEGKKIGWRDGVRALYCIFRYGPLLRRSGPRAPLEPPASFEAADDELAGTLHSLDGAANYADWLSDLIRPYLGSDICEVGAGHGTLTGRFSKVGTVVACDPSGVSAEVLESRFRGDDRVEVVHGDFEAAAKDRDFDSIVLVNVLEHIEDDEGSLASFADHLRPGGHVIVFAPAFDALYSEFDRSIGHQRRYRRGSLARSMYRAGLEVVELRYVNSVGALAWWALAKKLRRAPTRPASVAAYDRLVVPVLRRVEHGRDLAFGQSVLCIGRRPGPSGG